MDGGTWPEVATHRIIIEDNCFLCCRFAKPFRRTLCFVITRFRFWLMYVCFLFHLLCLFWNGATLAMNGVDVEQVSYRWTNSPRHVNCCINTCPSTIQKNNWWKCANWWTLTRTDWLISMNSWKHFVCASRPRVIVVITVRQMEVSPAVAVHQRLQIIMRPQQLHLHRTAKQRPMVWRAYKSNRLTMTEKTPYSKAKELSWVERTLVLAVGKTWHLSIQFSKRKQMESRETITFTYSPNSNPCVVCTFPPLNLKLNW